MAVAFCPQAGNQAMGQSVDWPYKDATPGAKIEYVNPEIPNVPLKPFEGEYYEDLVPDTLDAAEMARLTINCLTYATNPNQDYEQYFSLYIGNPFRMAHNFSDWCTPKYQEALPLLRIASGDRVNMQVDKVWQDVILKSLGPDGLYYFPIIGKPWYGKELWWSNGIARADGTIFQLEKPSEDVIAGLDTYAQAHAHSVVEESGITQFSHPQPCGRVINVMLIYYMRDGNPIWKKGIEKMVDRLLELAVHKDDYCYFPAYYFEPNAKFDEDDPRSAPATGLQGGEINGRLGEGPARFYELTGYEPARELATKLTRYMRYHDNYFAEDGEFKEYHFHGGTIYLINILETALATGDTGTRDFVERCFNWLTTPEAGSSTLVGFFPEHVKTLRPSTSTAEGCELGDMLILATELSSGGAGDYYEEAERWARNHFAEHQLTPSRAATLQLVGAEMEPREPLYNETIDGVAERNVGGFSSWSYGNDWWGGYRDTDNLIMHCCTGNCSRAIYFLWEHILHHKDGELKVNMLLNRASPWADVYSYIPYEGQVDIKMKEDCRDVMVHAPEWIETGSGEIAASVNGKARKFSWKDRYIDLGAVKKGDEIEVTFPISERTVKEQIGHEEYTLVIKGNTVVFIDPPGENCPLYQRDHYRDNSVRWRKVKRFVSNELIDY